MTYEEAVAKLDARKTPLRLAGHKLTRWNSGSQSGYRNGRCECGLRVGPWTTQGKDVTRAHQQHLQSVYLRPFKEAREERLHT